LVAFLDILGFSREIESKWNNEVDHPVEKIFKFKESLPKNYELEVEHVKSQTKRAYGCRVQSISDSIIVSFGYEPKPVLEDLIWGTIVFFETISIIWRNCLEAGFTIRGAADFGPIHWNEKEIIGPSLISAYKLEQTHAKTSRVIISSSLNQKLTDIRMQAKALCIDTMLKMLKKDIDGFVSLNPHSLYLDDSEKQHIIEILVKLRDETHGHSREKYAPLLACLCSEKSGLHGNELGKY
jgi:hypothetical protein